MISDAVTPTEFLRPSTLQLYFERRVAQTNRVGICVPLLQI